MAEKCSKHPGIEVRHSGTCPAASGGARCSCTPTYRVKVYSAREGRTVRKSFGSLAEAKRGAARRRSRFAAG